MMRNWNWSYDDGLIRIISNNISVETKEDDNARLQSWLLLNG